MTREQLRVADYLGHKRIPGSGKGQILFMAENFDAIPQGFEDYIG